MLLKNKEWILFYIFIFGQDEQDFQDVFVDPV